MTETLERLRHQIDSVAKLSSVVRTMKALAAANLGQYERAVASLELYRRTVSLGIGACLRARGDSLADETAPPVAAACLVVFGSDQGLVGQFNESLAARAATELGGRAGGLQVIAVGERLLPALADADLPVGPVYPAAFGIEAVSPLIGKLLVAIESARRAGEVHEVFLAGNVPGGAAGYQPQLERLLPLDRRWFEARVELAWPTASIPEALGGPAAALAPLIRQELFVAMFAACARSLAAENTTRLLAMQRAERNIDELEDELGQRFNRRRQGAIDDELFDLVGGFEALTQQQV